MTNIEKLEEAIERAYQWDEYVQRYIVREKHMQTVIAAAESHLLTLKGDCVVVPREPTTKILKAMWNCPEDAPWAVLYKAMIAAAPPAEDKPND